MTYKTSYDGSLTIKEDKEEDIEKKIKLLKPKYNVGQWVSTIEIRETGWGRTYKKTLFYNIKEIIRTTNSQGIATVKYNAIRFSDERKHWLYPTTLTEGSLKPVSKRKADRIEARINAVML